MLASSCHQLPQSLHNGCMNRISMVAGNGGCTWTQKDEHCLQRLVQLLPLDQTKKGVIILLEVIDSDDQEEVDMELNKRGRKAKLGAQEMHLGATRYFLAQF